MGLLDYINGFLEEVSTREGRERQLGIPANKRDRALRKRAVEEFEIKNPDFHIQGDTHDYDGYVQYIRDGEKYCTFIEGERNCWKAADHYMKDLGYDSVHKEVTARQLIPEIRDLIASYDQYLLKKNSDEKYLINVVLAQIWLDRLFNDPSQEVRNKKMIYEQFIELISNKEIPFYSIAEIEKYGVYTELLVVSKIMMLKNINLGFKGFEITPINDEVFESFRDGSYEYLRDSFKSWHYFFKRHHNITHYCDPLLSVDKWA